MTIIATCGHELKKSEELGIAIAIKDFHKDGSKAVSYITVCKKCFKWYKKKKLILETGEEIDDYLN